MNNESSKLRLHQTAQSTSIQHAEQQAQVREFASVEEMIRADMETVDVPPSVGERLNEAISREPRPAAPWWKRLFGG
jgi:hypothetical protein